MKCHRTFMQYLNLHIGACYKVRISYMLLDSCWQFFVMYVTQRSIIIQLYSNFLHNWNIFLIFKGGGGKGFLIQNIKFPE